VNKGIPKVVHFLVELFLKLLNRNNDYLSVISGNDKLGGSDINNIKKVSDTIIYEMDTLKTRAISFRKLQFYSFISGMVLFMVWRLLEMYLLI